MPIVITNCSNNYGPHQYPEKLIPLMVLSARAGRPLPVYGDGGQVRDWLYVEDHCEALWTVLQRGLLGETYHIGGNTQPTNLEVVRQICTVLDRLLPTSPYRPHDALIQFVADRPGHDRRYAVDTAKIRRELSWQPRHSFPEGLEGTVRWYLENGAWLSAIQEREEYRAWLKDNYDSRTPTAG
jgi:dTDP-glucose 4,6-dehydratase